MKRIGLFILTNLAVVLVLSVSLPLLGLGPLLQQKGINYQSLLVFAAIFGFGGAFISLLISKWTAKRLTGAQVITRPGNATEQWLVENRASPDPDGWYSGCPRSRSMTHRTSMPLRRVPVVTRLWLPSVPVFCVL